MQPAPRRLLPLLMLALIAAVQPAGAQYITITAADVQAQLAPGNTLANHNDSLSTQANIGRKGASKWDFTALRTDALNVYTSVAVATTPFAAEFPGATHAFQAPVSYLGIAGTGYQYLMLGTHLLNPGLKADLQGIFAKTTNTPIDTTYYLPSTYGTSWRSTFAANTRIYTLFGDLSNTTKNYAYVYTVDAYGPMKIPDGTSHQALRIRKVNTLTGGVGYIFLARDGASVQLNAASSAEPDSGLINVGIHSVSWTPASLSVPVAGMELTPPSFDIGPSPAVVYARVSNTGTGPLNWNAAGNDSWLAATAHGTDSVMIACQANPSTSPRTGTVTVTSNAINSPLTIAVTQAGSPVSMVLSVAPDTVHLSSEAGIAEFAVSNTGNGTMNWSASSGQLWAAITGGTTGSNSGTVKVSVQANSSTAQRQAAVTITAPGATGSPRTVVVEQAGIPVQTILTVTPDTVRVLWQAGTAGFTVRNTGNGTMAWSAVSSNPWASITAGSAGADSGRISLSFGANASVLPRSASVTVTAPGATGRPKQVVLLQDSCEAPGTPLLAAPGDGDTLKTDSVRLVWHRSAATVSAYWLDVVLVPMSAPLLRDSTITDTAYVMYGLIPGATYEWHVRAKNPTGWGAFTLMRLFTRLMNPPAAVTLLAPGNGNLVSRDSVRFTWLTSRPAVSGYRLEIASDSTFAHHVVDSTITDSTFLLKKPAAGASCWWRVSAWNVAGTGPVSPAWSFSVSLTSAPLDRRLIPSAFQLDQNYPNPFNPSTTIRYGVPKHCQVTLTVFNTLGQLVTRLVDASLEPGTYEVRFDASALPAGVYFYRMTAEGFVRTLRLVLVK